MPALKVVETQKRVSRRSPIVTRLHARAHRSLTDASDYPHLLANELNDEVVSVEILEAVPMVTRLSESNLATKLTQLAALADSAETANELRKLSQTITDAQALVRRWEQMGEVS